MTPSMSLIQLLKNEICRLFEFTNAGICSSVGKIKREQSAWGLFQLAGGEFGLWTVFKKIIQLRLYQYQFADFFALKKQHRSWVIFAGGPELIIDNKCFRWRAPPIRGALRRRTGAVCVWHHIIPDAKGLWILSRSKCFGSRAKPCLILFYISPPP